MMVAMLLLAAGLDWVGALGGAVQGEGQAVSLRGTWVTDGDLAELAKVPVLDTLDLSRTRVTDRGLFFLKGADQLRDVNLAFAENVGDPIHAVIRNWKSLRRLNLRGTRVGDATAASAAALPALEALDIALSDVQDFGLEALSGSTSLRELAMGGARISEPALQYLRQMQELRVLDLSGPTQAISFNGGMNLTDRSIDAIASVAALRELRLGYNRFAPRAMPVLKRLENVERLGLEYCPGVTDAAVPVLAEWKSLRIVELTGTKMTEKGIAELRRLRPDLQVLWSSGADAR